MVDDDHGPVADVLICLSRLKPGTAPMYSALDAGDA